jgi:Tfp pilus assembly ATPase PilU
MFLNLFFLNNIFQQRVLEALDEYCAEATFHEPRKPLILMGPPGCGKSAALANWIESRKQAKNANKSRLSSLNPKEEFVFWHVVGCSRQSTFVGHMLNRLMTELREHFEITREV